MICIQRESTDPYFNIAAEEYVFQNITEDVIMLWINDPCIVVGKHQNTLAEINIDFVSQNSIPVIRRISGGGTVYHDPGNLNYTFIRKGEKGSLIDYARHTRPIIDALRELGIEAKLEGKSDLTIAGRKFSGNAEHIYKDRVLHHGTLLFDTSLNLLEDSIRLKHQDYKDKGVKSIRSTVTNIKEHLGEPMSINDFRDFLITFLSKSHPGLSIRPLKTEEKKEIQELADRKYKTWEWNFAYSPRYKLGRKLQTVKGILDINLEIERGKINKVLLTGIERPTYFEVIEKSLLGVNHEEKSIRNKLNSINFDNSFHDLSIEDFIQGMF